MKSIFIVTTAILAATSLLAASKPAGAVVRFCENEISSGEVDGETEQAAKITAMTNWKTQAAKFGEGYDNWAMALGKSFTCDPGEKGGFTCVAVAQPCTFVQNPKNLPEGSVRIKPIQVQP